MRPFPFPPLMSFLQSPLVLIFVIKCQENQVLSFSCKGKGNSQAPRRENSTTGTRTRE